jgi:hypothetical protein
MQIIVQTFYAPGEKSRSPIRVRPLPGQGFSSDMRVECSREMRTAYPVGQLFCIYVKVTCRLDSPDFLYSSYRDPWNPVKKPEAEDFIKKNFTNRNQPT